jgi:predicted O-methyltransferase YrrM
MDFLSESLQKYIEEHSSGESELLKELDRETHLKVMMPRMLSGHVQGRFLSFLSKILKPERILEIGTYTGYASICLAEGLSSSGELVTIDKNEELQNMVEDYFRKAGIADKTRYLIGDATSIIPTLDGLFDLIFIDADKANYPNYYKMCLPMLSERGIILADNVLWSGKITSDKPDKNTMALQQFNDMVQNDPEVENMLLSIRDGLMLIRKK